MRLKMVIFESLKLRQFLQGNINFSCCPVILDTPNFVQLPFGQNLLWMINELIKCNLIGTVAHDILALVYFPIGQLNGHRLLAIIQYPIDPTPQFQLPTQLQIALLEYLRQPPIPTLNIPPLSFLILHQFSHYMMQ